MTWRSQDGQVELFVDGERRATTQLAQGHSFQAGGAFVVGQEQDNFGGGFQSTQALDGYVDEFRVYDRVLSAEEISQQTQWAYINNTGLKVALSFDESEGALALDAMGQANHAILSNVVRAASCPPVITP